MRLKSGRGMSKPDEVMTEIEFPVSSYDQIKLAENTIKALKGTWDNTHNPLAPREFWKASGHIRKAIEQLNKFLNPKEEKRRKRRRRDDY